jgi:hypothetical protein
MEKVAEQVRTWSFLQTLPESLAEFTLQQEFQQCGTQFNIFTYGNSARQRFFSVLYDEATDDFLCRVTIGLNQYYDVNFIVNDLPSLEAVLAAKMERLLIGLTQFEQNEISSVFFEKKITEWDFAAQLPAEAAGFSLFIQPREPIKVINGSFVIIDYSDFPAESNLIIYYNVFRDDFYGEIHLRRLPRTIGLFDARTLPELSDRLSLHLVPVLEQMRCELTAAGGEQR